MWALFYCHDVFFLVILFQQTLKQIFFKFQTEILALIFFTAATILQREKKNDSNLVFNCVRNNILFRHQM